MSTYELLLAIHILAAVIWVGGGLTIHIIGRRALASGDRQRMLQFAQDGSWIGPRIYAPTSLVLLIAGILLIGETPYEHSDLWVTVAYVGYFISFLIGVLYYGRADKKRDALVAQEGIDGPGFIAVFKQVMLVNTIELAILLAIVVDMAVKPGS